MRHSAMQKSCEHLPLVNSSNATFHTSACTLLLDNSFILDKPPSPDCQDTYKFYTFPHPLSSTLPNSQLPRRHGWKDGQWKMEHGLCGGIACTLINCYELAPLSSSSSNATSLISPHAALHDAAVLQTYLPPVNSSKRDIYQSATRGVQRCRSPANRQYLHPNKPPSSNAKRICTISLSSPRLCPTRNMVGRLEMEHGLHLRKSLQLTATNTLSPEINIVKNEDWATVFCDFCGSRDVRQFEEGVVLLPGVPGIPPISPLCQT